MRAGRPDGIDQSRRRAAGANARQLGTQAPAATANHVAAGTGGVAEEQPLTGRTVAGHCRCRRGAEAAQVRNDAPNLFCLEDGRWHLGAWHAPRDGAEDRRIGVAVDQAARCQIWPARAAARVDAVTARAEGAEHRTALDDSQSITCARILGRPSLLRLDAGKHGKLCEHTAHKDRRKDRDGNPADDDRPTNDASRHINLLRNS